MPTYTLFGIQVYSELPLPVSPSSHDRNIDVTIRCKKFDHSSVIKDDPEYLLNCSAEKALFYWKEIGAFLVRHGNEILIDSLPGVSPDLIQLPLLGIVFSAVLRQRNYLVLHASAVLLEDNTAVAFLGRRGQGKSSLAGAFYAQGYPLIGDDVVAINFMSGSLQVYPGFPQIKLMPEVLALLFKNTQTPEYFQIDGQKKSIVWAKNKFSSQPVSLKCLFFLELSDDENVTISKLPLQEGFRQLISQSYTARVFQDFVTPTEAEQHFQLCSQVLKETSLFKLKRTTLLERLVDLPDLIAAHCALI